MDEELLVNRSSKFRKKCFCDTSGVDTNTFTPCVEKQSHNKNVVLFVGRLVALKGILYMVRAIPLILKEHPNTFFVFVGPGDKEPYIKELDKRGIKKENFLFLGQR